MFTHRPAGADPRARHAGAEGDLDGRHDAEPRQRGAAVGGRQPLPQHAAGPRGGPVHRDPHAGAGGARSSAITAYLAAYEVETQGVYIQDVDVPGRARRGADQARDRQPGEGDVRGAAARRRRRASRWRRRKGTADMQAQLAQSRRSASRSSSNEAEAREARGRRARRRTSSSPVGPRRRRSRRSVSPRRRRSRRSASPGPRASRRRREAIGETRDRARRGGQRGGRGPHHRRARGARHRRRRLRSTAWPPR